MGERENERARARHARGARFFLVPTTSKRLLRRLKSQRNLGRGACRDFLQKRCWLGPARMDVVRCAPASALTVSFFEKMNENHVI